MSNTADIVIIGGGPAGTAALWALNRAEPSLRITLIEQNDHLGGGSSVASLECYRSCWSTACIAQQMQRSIAVFYNADHYLGDGASDWLGIRKHGYLFCGFTDQHAAILKSDVAHLHSMGLDHVEYLDTDEVHYRFPWLGERAIAAKFDPMAGSIDSNALVQAYVRQAANAQIVLKAPNVQICVENGKVTGVQTADSTITASSVIIACGAGSWQVGKTAGVHLPVVVRPRQSFTTPWRHDAIPEDAPMIIGSHPFPHLKPEARSGAIFGWEYHWNAKAAEAGHDHTLHDALRKPVYPATQLKDPRFPSITLMLLGKQFGHDFDAGFNDRRYLRSIQHNIGYYVYRDASAAYHTNTQEPYMSERAIIDAHPDVDGLFLSIAHSGHGIMTSPAAGEIIASKVLGYDLPHPNYADFGVDVPWVAHDMNAL